MYYVEYDQTSAYLYNEEEWEKHKIKSSKRQAIVKTNNVHVALGVLTGLQREINEHGLQINWSNLGGMIMDIPTKSK